MALPQTMKQVRFSGPGGPEVIEIETAPVPQPGAGQVLIAVGDAAETLRSGRGSQRGRCGERRC